MREALLFKEYFIFVKKHNTAKPTTAAALAPDKFVALPAEKPKTIKYVEKAFREIESYVNQGFALIVTAETSALYQKMALLPNKEGLVEVKKDNATLIKSTCLKDWV